jgi:hypothetical protein
MTKIKDMTDKELLEDEHDTLVDITHDTTLDAELHKHHKALMEEIKKRGLTLLPRLNGTISF